MPNMSYCRFRNTLQDLRDCWYALNEEVDLDGLGEEEERAKNSLVRLCGEIHEEYGEEEGGPDA